MIFDKNARGDTRCAVAFRRRLIKITTTRPRAGRL